MRIDLVRKFLALNLVFLPMFLLTALGAVEHLLARRALGLGRFLAHGAQAGVVRIKLFDQTHLKSMQKMLLPKALPSLTVGSVYFKDKQL